MRKITSQEPNFRRFKSTGEEKLDKAIAWTVAAFIFQLLRIT